MLKKITPLLAAALILGGCSSDPKVKRVSSDTVIDLSGYWNDTDVRTVCRTLIDQCLSSQRVMNALSAFKGRNPTVLVGNFYNDSSEHIDTSIITSKMENAIFDSGRLDFVAGDRVRNQLRGERQDQQSAASIETAKKLGKEIGADFLLTGSVKTIVDSAGSKQVRTYFVSASLYNIETGALVWKGEDDSIKKYIERAKNKF